ncbi:MAG: polysaccharide deacetylase family protein [Bacteroidia bacterium]
MRRLLADIAFRWDHWKAKRSGGAQPALRIYMFHSLFAHEQARDAGLAFPHEGITVSQFEAFIKISKEQGCHFITPGELLHAEPRQENCILITFDDGYANNLSALPILEKYEVPALFCVATDFIAEGKAFWWDVIWRKEGAGKAARALLESRKSFSPAANEQFIMERYGNEALQPVGEVDRPLSIEELKTFASNPLVHIANHSHTHPLFTQLSQQQIEDEITASQKLLSSWIGEKPDMFAYPNGSHQDETGAALQAIGLQHAFTTERCCYMSGENLPFHLGRIPLYGARDIAAQLAIHQNVDAGWYRR